MVNKKFKKIFTSTKNIIVLITPGKILKPLTGFLYGAANLILFKIWVAKNAVNVEMDDYFTLKRDYSKRYALYQHVVETYDLAQEKIYYLEFGVSKGFSFKWWLGANENSGSRFFGFDTFEGLPEAWGQFKKGAMEAGIPDVTDKRAFFVKGLFQDTLYDFLNENDLRGQRNIFHLDADLFTATIFTLAGIHEYLKPGDILLFDEFNVPNHEFHAFKIFEDSFNIKYKVVGSVNNYFQVAMEIL